MTKRSAVDGFVPRRSPGVIGETQASSERKLPQANFANSMQRRVPIEQGRKMPTHIAQDAHNGLAPSSAQNHGLTRADIDDSLSQIDAEQQAGKKTKSTRRGKFPWKRRKVIKFVIIAIAIILLAIGGWVAVKALIASQSVFKGDVFGIIQQKKLQQDSNGRTNILVLGTSEDDPGHEGAHLTDSIMILSVDQTSKNAYLISIPRDLQVEYGRACNSGYSGKINEYFNCVNDDWTSDSAETERQTATRSFIGNIVGIDIQYSAHVNYTVMRDVVSALGTITVNIEGSNGASGVMDSNFDWKCKGGNEHASLATMKKNCPPNGHYIEYANGPATLDAEHALYLAQARGDSYPTYGLSRSNFDREQNQQKIIMAIREKAMSAGTLTNISKVTGLIDAMGGNLRTNFQTSEIRTLMSLAQDIQSSAIQRLDLQADGIMTGDAQPAAGLYNFTQLQAYIKKKIYATGISKEDSHVIVLNASGVTGAAQVEADKLTALGITVDAVDNAPASMTVSANTIYQVGDTAKTKTAAKLSELYGATPKTVTSLTDVTLGDNTDYVIVLVKANTSATGNTTAE